MDIDLREKVKTRTKYLFSAVIQGLQRRDGLFRLMNANLITIHLNDGKLNVFYNNLNNF